MWRFDGLRGPGPLRRGEGQRDQLSTSGGLLATNLPLLPGRLQPPVALRVDLLVPPHQDVLRSDEARCAVQADVVVVVHLSA